jgi:hypothetical protein
VTAEEEKENHAEEKVDMKDGYSKHDLEDKKTHKTTTFHAVSIPVFFRNASQYKKYTPLGCDTVL